MTTSTATHRRRWFILAALVGIGGASSTAESGAMVVPATWPPAVGTTAAPADTNTFAYTSGGVRVIQRLTPGNDVVDVQLYLLGGVLQLVPATAGIEELALRTLAYGSARYPGAASRRALARTGSRWGEGSGWDWSTVGFVSLSDRFDSTWAVFADRIAYCCSIPRRSC